MHKPRLLIWASAVAASTVLAGCILPPPHGHGGPDGRYEQGGRPGPGPGGRWENDDRRPGPPPGGRWDNDDRRPGPPPGGRY